jgi:glycerol-3-phosphate dehydrogenase
MLAQDAELAKQLDPELPYIAAEVVWAARMEMARSVEDVLARRTRALFLNARAAVQMAQPVARLLAGELDRDDAWIAAQTEEFCELAKQYMV